MSLYDLLHMRIIRVDNSRAALAKQHGLACQVFLKRCMFIRPDMVWLQICKNTDIKCKPAHTVHFQSLRGHLHHTGPAAFVGHFTEILLDNIRFRRRIGSRHMRIADNCFNRSNQSGLVPGAFQNGFYHIRCRRLAFGSGNADGHKPLCRIGKPRGRKLCQRQPRVRHPQDTYALWHLDVLLCDYGCGFFCSCFARKGMAVINCAPDADKQASRLDFPGIIDKRRDFPARAFCQQTVFHAFCKFFNCHKIPPSILCILSCTVWFSLYAIIQPKAIAESMYCEPHTVHSVTSNLRKSI